MDIKEIILLVVGTLIVLVIAHGLWVAWRNKSHNLRFDMMTGGASGDVDEIELLRGELPNGGARLVEAGEGSDPVDRSEFAGTYKEKTADVNSVEDDKTSDPNLRILTQEALDFSGSSSQPKATGYFSSKKKSFSPFGDLNNLKKESRSSSEVGKSEWKLDSGQEALSKADDDTFADTNDIVQELIVLNVLAPAGLTYDGRLLIEAMQSQDLKYGDMNIFHRLDHQTKKKLFSVADAVEPGTFDLSDLDNMQSSGVTFFMQLPAVHDPSIIFDLMLNAARNLVLEMGGSLKDEQLSVLTGQTVEHMRQRIADFSRRRMSIRA